MNRANSSSTRRPPPLKILPLMALLMAATAGCPRGQMTKTSPSKASRTSINAMADLQAGRMDAAIEGFEKVTLDEPRNYAAHFQLATLLQDVKKDYVGAIAHYRAHIKLRPSSENSSLAEERMKLCERLYTAAMTDNANVTAAFEAEKAKLIKARDAAVAKASKLEADLTAARREAETLRQRVDSQHKMLAKLGSDAQDGSAAPPQKPRSKLHPSDADLLDDPDEKPTDRFSASEEAKKLRALLDAEDADDRKNPAAFPKPPSDDDAGSSSPAQTAGQEGGRKQSAFDALLGGKKKSSDGGPSRPETYVVEEGDTLMGISARFYGTNTKWRKIRDANRGIISPDGRVRIGQEIKLP